MARIFCIYAARPQTASDWAESIGDACCYLKKAAHSRLRETLVSALGENAKLYLLEKEDEPDRLWRDPTSGVVVAVDGSPQVGAHLLSARELGGLYLQLGAKAMADRVDGGWTAIILDERDNKVVLLRDRLGLKPFYYADSGDFLLAGSNAGALMRSGLLPRQANTSTIAKYAACHYRTTYGRSPSFFAEVKLLTPASLYIKDSSGAKEERYWDLDASTPFLQIDAESMEQLYREHLQRMIRNYLQERPVAGLGIALSGGIDSGTICGLVHQHLSGRIDAISMTYAEETDFDETYLIKCSVRDHVRNWHAVNLDAKVLLRDLMHMYECFDVPLATISIYGYDYLYREAAKRGFQRLLTGAGGDYIQAGNYTNFYYYLADLKVSDTDLYEKELQCWIRHHGTKQFPKSPETAEAFFDRYLDLSKPGHLRAVPMFLADPLLSPEFREEVGNFMPTMVRSYGEFARTYVMQEYFYDAVAPGAEAEDLIDWRWGTEMISPFFCKDVVEFGWTIPSQDKIKDGVNKVLARRSLDGICAREILDRVDKSGFNAPFDLWVRGVLNDFVMDTFRAASFRGRGIYDLPTFDGLLAQHMQGEANHMMLIWQALNLELWMQAWIDRKP